MERLRVVEHAFTATTRAWGYYEVRTPAIEPLHLITSAGTLSPQALDRVYSFLDWDGWSGERVVLRPDSTIAVARLYAEQLDGGRVARLSYSQDVFHFADDDSPRADWQCGVELIGDTGLAGDVELILLALDVLRTLEVPQPTVRVSHAGLVRAALAAAGLPAQDQSAAYDRLLDGDLGAVDEIERRLPELDAPLRLLFDTPGEGSGYVANLKTALGARLPGLAAPLHDLAFVVAALEARGVRPLVQAALARSFEYYSGVVMNIECGGARVCAGGRYDDLLSLVGGAATPASGFALYAAPLMSLVPTPAAAMRRVAVEAASDTPAALAAAAAAAARVRAAGFIAEFTPGVPDAPHLVCDVTGFRAVSAAGERAFETIEPALAYLEQSL
jgi:histidyl-tRNA synthetase